MPGPEFSAEELAQGGRVAAEIRARIDAAGGWLPFAQFMEAALYAPGLGYYMTPRPLFGAAGDYVTAPELSPLFAACLANGVADLLARTGGGDVVEFGAGSGVMAAELRAALHRLGAPVGRYRIVEPSPALAERQRRTIASHAQAQGFEWLVAPPDGGWQGVAIANEVVDALPVERFRVDARGCEALGVTAEAGGFAFAPRPAEAALAAAVESLQRRLPAPMPPGFVSELRLGQRDWLAGAAARLTRGVLLVIDYGLPRAQYYHASRDGGTLCAFRRHLRIEDVLAHPGLQDLTAWVDFSALAEDAADCGLALAGFATQAHYLLATGVEQELARLETLSDERARLALRQGASTLLLPGEMGERFKVMALSRDVPGPVRGFGFRDLAASL